MKRILPQPLHTIIAAILLCAGMFLFTRCDEELPGIGSPCGGVQEPVGMKCVPGGTFIRGSDDLHPEEDTGRMTGDESPAMAVAVGAFFMDLFEVTFSQYQACVRAGACSYARPYYTGYDRPNQPMLGVTWFQARDYCRWRGKRLPTEAEWEKAARGDRGELFPWGDGPCDCTKAVIEEKGKKGCGAGTTWDVGAKGPSRYGLFDMAGNSWEWVNDWYSESYGRCGAACAGSDPAGPCGGAEKCPGHEKKVLRGGSWWWGALYSRGSNRRSHYPDNNPYHHLGFRCAKSAK